MKTSKIALQMALEKQQNRISSHQMSSNVNQVKNYNRSDSGKNKFKKKFSNPNVKPENKPNVVCSKCTLRGHAAQDCRIKCKFCRKEGHIVKNCYKKKNSNRVNAAGMTSTDEHDMTEPEEPTALEYCFRVSSSDLSISHANVAHSPHTSSAVSDDMHCGGGDVSDKTREKGDESVVETVSVSDKTRKGGLPAADVVCANTQAGSTSNEYVDTVSCSKVVEKYKTHSVALNINQNNNNSKVIKMFVNGRNVQFQVDTGSDITCMSRSTFDNLNLVGATLQKSDKKSQIIVASGHMVPAHSVFISSVLVRYRDREFRLVLRVVDCSFPTLLGRDWMNALFGDGWFERMTSVNALKGLKTFEQEREEFIAEMSKSVVFQPGVGRVSEHEACLNLKESCQPKFHKARPVAYAEKDEISAELDRLVDCGYYQMIEKSDWASPIVSVRKPDGTIRLCGDYKRTLNPALDMKCYPLPIVEDCFVKMKGGIHFTKIDIKQAFNSLPLRACDQELATINTHRGLYKPLVLPYGIKTATSSFQETMDKLLGDMDYVATRVDDIICTGPTTKQHLDTVREVMRRLEKCGFKCRAEKCQFLEDKVIYLGYEISKQGVRPCKSKVETLTKAPYPTCLSELVSFLGAVQYYSRFLKNLSTLIEPLNRLRTSEWRFEEEEKRCFDELKKRLTSNEVLTFYDPKLPIRLDCDASSYGIGAVISIVDKDGVDRPIEFISRTLSPTERRYAQIEREALSIVWAVKRLHRYLYARDFEIITDHEPLKYLFSPHRGIPEMASSRIQRWAITLSSYSFTLKYRSTKEHGNADLCSRFPLPEINGGTQLDLHSELRESSPSVFSMYMSEESPLLNAEMIARESSKDPVLSRVMFWVREGWPSKQSGMRQVPEKATSHSGNLKKSCGSERRKVKSQTSELVPEKATSQTGELMKSNETEEDRELKSYRNRKDELSLESGCLLWGHRTIIPAVMRHNILKLLHSTHSGMSAMKHIARNYVWWPKLDHDIEAMVRQCYACALNKNMPPKAKPHPWIRPSEPWDRLHLDFAGPFRGKMWLLVIDAYSKWLEVFDMRNDCTSSNLIRKLKFLFNRYGLCKLLVSDNGPQLVSEEFKQFCTLKGIQHIPIPSYHPASNGQAESVVGKFKKAMKKMSVSSTDFEMNLSDWLFHYHNTPHSTTKVEPAVLFQKRRLRSPLSLLSPLSYAPEVRVREETARVESEKTLRRFKPGDSVQYRDVRKGVWIKGTVKHGSDKVYEIETEDGAIVQKHIDHVVADSTADQPNVSQSPELVKLERAEVQSKPEVRGEQDMARDRTYLPNPIKPVFEPTEAAKSVSNNTEPVAGNVKPVAVPQPSARPTRTVRRPDYLKYDKLGG